MTDLLKKTGQRLRENLSQQRYQNGGGISRKDAWKIAGFGLAVLVGGTVWHDVFGLHLPSDHVWEFFEHAMPAIYVAGGVWFARRVKP